MRAVEERFLDLPSARTRVLERPGGADGVLFVHGITSSARTWKPFMEGLPPQTRAIAFDTLGNGYTELKGPRRPITYEDQTRHMLELADELGIDSFAGVGHSWGCASLLRAAWQRPGRVRGLLLEDPTALGRPKLAGPMRIAHLGAPGRAILEMTATRRMLSAQAHKRLRQLAGREVDAETFEREAGHAIADPKRQVRGFIDLVAYVDPRKPASDVDRYAGIECPVWILRGSEDRDWMPQESEERFRELMPSARIIRWDGIDHAPHIQVPDRYAQLLEDFLAATEESARPGSGPRASDERGIS